MPAGRGRHRELLPRVQAGGDRNDVRARRDRRLGGDERPAAARDHRRSHGMKPLTIASCLAVYRSGESTPRETLARLRAAQSADDPAWIHRCDEAFVDAQLRRLEALPDASLPLYGVPFAV